MLQCDWCGLDIEERLYATMEPGGFAVDGKRINIGPRIYHTSYLGHGGKPYEQCCFSKALRYLEGGEFKTPDAGMVWRLIPASEVQNEVYTHNYNAPVLGTTPLEQLGLPDRTYSKLTKHGVFTVEHLVDLRRRGQDVYLTTKALQRVDAALIDGGHIPTQAIEASS